MSIDERVRRERGELARERLDDHGVGAGLGEQLDAAVERAHGRRRALRREQRGRVRIERQRDRPGAAGAASSRGATDQRLVAAMDAIEVADRDGRPGRPAGGVLVATDQLPWRRR